MTDMTVGQNVRRVDACEKVTGQAKYCEDLGYPSALHGKVLRSPLAHAKILAIQTEKARKLPGVKAVVIGKDLTFLGGEALKDYPFLAVEKVRYVGEPVAAVAAVDEQTAEKAVDLITVDYEALPAVLDPLKAMEPDAPLVHEKLHTYKHIPILKPVAHSNICHHIEFVKGDIQKGFEESDFVFEDTFTTHMVQHGAIERHMAVAQVASDGRITIWVNTQEPHRLRNDLAGALGLPLKQLRVILPAYMGGGFGGKAGLKAETLAIALALHSRCRPVKIALTREEVFTSSIVRHPSVVRIKTGIKKDGTLWAREVKVIYDTGAYTEKGPTVCLQACVAAPGPYKIPNVRVEGYCVYTNKTIAGAYRGYGVPQVAWAHESQMDMIAHRLGMDPVALRLKNVVGEGDSSPTGRQILHSVGVKECIQKVVLQMEGKGGSKEKNRGIGIACGFKNTKTPSGSSAIVKVGPDGSIEVLMSTVEMGQGAKTILTQMVAQELGVSLESITMPSPDTDFTPFDASTTSSGSTFRMGNAIRAAARDARNQLVEMASAILKTPPEKLLVDQGKIYSIDAPGHGLSFAEVIRNKYGAGLDIIGKGFYYPALETEGEGMWAAPSMFWMCGAYAVEVAVDIDTGQVNLLKVSGAFDVGKAINPVMCEVQIEGGMVHGMGICLFEEMKVGPTGMVLNPSFADYKMPTARDIPKVIPLIVEEAHREGPWGAKGIGEISTVPIAPAIANAIFDAVGVRIKDLPITPEKILSALKKSGVVEHSVSRSVFFLDNG